MVHKCRGLSQNAYLQMQTWLFDFSEKFLALMWSNPIHSSLRSNPCLPFQNPVHTLCPPALQFSNTSHWYPYTPCLCMGVIPSRKCTQTPSFLGCPALLVCLRLRGFLGCEILSVEIRTVPGKPRQLVILFSSPVHVCLGCTCLYSGPEFFVEWMGVDVGRR